MPRLSLPSLHKKADHRTWSVFCSLRWRLVTDHGLVSSAGCFDSVTLVVAFVVAFVEEWANGPGWEFRRCPTTRSAPRWRPPGLS